MLEVAETTSGLIYFYGGDGLKYKRSLILVPILVLSITSSTAIEAKITKPIEPVPEIQFKPVPEKHMVFVTPDTRPEPTKPSIEIPEPVAIIENVEPDKPFILDKNVSWYGPGFYGRRTACGQAYTKEILGVAHKTLPCGTLVTFKWGKVTKTVPVIDRGPYVAGRQWDLSGGLCVALDHCFTGEIYYRIE